jgi:hypothetical protein
MRGKVQLAFQTMLIDGEGAGTPEFASHKKTGAAGLIIWKRCRCKLQPDSLASSTAALGGRDAVPKVCLFKQHVPS